jgi:hypothetical protein
MKYFGLILIPLLVALFLGGPGCTQSQDEPAVKMEKAPEEAAEAPAAEEAEKVVEVEEVVVEVEEPAEAEKEGKGLLDQVKDKAEEEAGEEIEKIEIE